MKSRSILFTLLVLVAMIILAACGGAAATQPPATQAPMIEMFAATQAPAIEAPIAVDQAQSANKSAEQSVGVAAAPAPTMAAFEINNQNGENIIVQNTNRKIIKNADISLQVKETNNAVNGATQVIADLGGYIISSR